MKNEVPRAVWLPWTMVWDVKHKILSPSAWQPDEADHFPQIPVWLSRALSGYQQSHFGTGTSALKHMGKWQHYIWTRWTALYKQHPSQPFQDNLLWYWWALCCGEDPDHANLVSIECTCDACLQSCRDLMGHRIGQWESGMWRFCLGKEGTDQYQCMSHVCLNQDVADHIGNSTWVQKLWLGDVFSNIINPFGEAIEHIMVRQWSKNIGKIMYFASLLNR